MKTSRYSAQRLPLWHKLAPVLRRSHTHRMTLVVTYYFPRGLITKRQCILRTFDDYTHLKTLKGPIKTSYVMTFLMITLLITFSTIWVGLHLAQGITIPIEQLAEGTRREWHTEIWTIFYMQRAMMNSVYLLPLLIR